MAPHTKPATTKRNLEGASLQFISYCKWKSLKDLLVIQIKITTGMTSKATLTMIMRTMKTVIRTVLSATMRVYKSVTSCVLPNLVEHAGHGKQDISITDQSLMCKKKHRTLFVNNRSTILSWGRVTILLNGVRGGSEVLKLSEGRATTSWPTLFLILVALPPC